MEKPRRSDPRAIDCGMYTLNGPKGKTTYAEASGVPAAAVAHVFTVLTGGPE